MNKALWIPATESNWLNPSLVGGILCVQALRKTTVEWWKKKQWVCRHVDLLTEQESKIKSKVECRVMRQGV